MAHSNSSADLARLLPTGFVTVDPETQIWYWDESDLDNDSETALLARLFTLWAKRDGGLKEVMSQLMLDDYGGQPPAGGNRRVRQGRAEEMEGEEDDNEEYSGSDEDGSTSADFDRVPPPYL